MASPGDLIRASADALDMPLVTVGAYYRTLREAGLVTRGGRGRSSPVSTPHDAAVLLTALLAADTGVDADEAVVRFSSLPALIEFEAEVGFGADKRPIDLSAYAERKFVAALALLISSFEQVIRDLEQKEFQGRKRIRVWVCQTDVVAEIRVGGTVVHFEDATLSGRPDRPHLTVTREIGEASISMLAKSLFRS